MRIGVGYMGLVFLAVLISSLSLRFPLIYYKQRRSKVSQRSMLQVSDGLATVPSKGLGFKARSVTVSLQPLQGVLNLCLMTVNQIAVR